MQKIQKTLYSSILASESIHIFCCGLPTIFSVLSLLSGMGMIASMPAFIEGAHNVIHAYELPMIALSGVILVLGWALYIYSRRIDCRTEGACAHAPCETKKDRTRTFMIAATILFIVNLGVYWVFHRNIDEHFHAHPSHDIVVYDHEHNHNH